jgi:hypothetical protein
VRTRATRFSRTGVFSIFSQQALAGSTENPSSIARPDSGIHPHFNERCISDELLLSLRAGQALYRAPHPTKSEEQFQDGLD